MWSTTACIDSANHTLFFAFSGTAGTAVFYLDGSNADDTGHANRVAPTTGTLDAGASSSFVLGSASAAGASLSYGGYLGFVGHREAYLTNWSDFMQTDGTPKQLDETTWTEWGAQPLFWHESGLMTENKGSAGAMTANGTIILAAASTWS